MLLSSHLPAGAPALAAPAPARTVLALARSALRWPARALERAGRRQREERYLAGLSHSEYRDLTAIAAQQDVPFFVKRR